MAEGFEAAAPSGLRRFTSDTAAAELPGLIGYTGQPPGGSVIVAATGPGGARAVLVLPENIDHPKVREQTLTALAQAQSSKLLLVGYGQMGDANALAVDDVIHTAPPGAQESDHFWATQVLHARAGRVRDLNGPWRLQPRPAYLEGLTPTEKARLVRSVAVEASELREQMLINQPGGMSERTHALKVAAQLIVREPLMRDVAIAELVGQDDGLNNALALYASIPGTQGVNSAAAGMVAAVAAAQNPSSGLIRMTRFEGQTDPLWKQVDARASEAAREGLGFPLEYATLTSQSRFTTDRTPGKHWPAAGQWRQGPDRSAPPMDRATLESLAGALGHDLRWEGETAVTATTRHETTDGLYEAPAWGTWPLAVGTTEGLRSIVGDTVDATPHRPGSVSNSEFDPIIQLELERRMPANGPRLS